MNTKNFFWLFLLLLTALRLRVAGQFGLTADEAHYVLYGKIIDFSYFDHPPLVGWVQALFQHVGLNHLIQARLAAIIISVVTSLLLLDFLKIRGVNDQNAQIAVMTLNLTPMFNAMSVALLPDTLLMPLTVLIVSTTERIVQRSTASNWLLLGLWLGLAGLSKYTAALYVAALVLIFIFRGRIKEILKPQLWLGVTLAAVLVSPVIYWNMKNGWISLKYQSDHVFSFDSSILRNLVASLLIQLISWGIGPFLISLSVFFLMVRRFRHFATYQLTLIFLSVFLCFFIYIGLSTPLLPHWMLIFFVLGLPVSVAYLLEQKKWTKSLSAAIVVSTTLSLLLLFELGFKIFPIRQTASLYEGISGWETVMSEANKKLEEIQKEKKALAVMNWTLGSRAMYYNAKPSKVFVIDSRFDQFDIWAPESNIGYDLVAIIEAGKRDEHLANLNCAQLTPIGEQKSLIKDVPVNHFVYYHCAGFLGQKLSNQ